MRESKISYVTVWRNAYKSKHNYFVPYPGHPACDDFTEFSRQPDVIFVK